MKMFEGEASLVQCVFDAKPSDGVPKVILPLPSSF
jgi:hypothetical protein